MPVKDYRSARRTRAVTKSVHMTFSVRQEGERQHLEPVRLEEKDREACKIGGTTL
jgi:hypothetical protein